MPDGPITLSVTVESRAGDKWAILAVRDAGLGIPASELPHLFERFRRASKLARRFSGTGLGLANARQLVEQHGGTIAIESVEGVGTTVIIALPLANPTP